MSKNSTSALASIAACEEYLRRRKAEVEECLWASMPPAGEFDGPLVESMRYPLEAGGKRIRPVLVLVGADFCRGISGEDCHAGRHWEGADEEWKQALLKVACSIELIHTYSLVHDDLPCMDDDDLRRGRPTTHKVFGEAMAVLAGDALQTLGFEWIFSLPDKFAAQAALVARELAGASGWRGMVAGQAVDLEYESKPGDERVLEYIHLHKTAALIRASLLMGARMAGADQRDYQLLSETGSRLGLIFQVVDDILDVVGDAKLLGKNPGADENHHKLTYPALIGLERSRQRVDALRNGIESMLEPEGPRGRILLELTRMMVDRKA